MRFIHISDVHLGRTPDEGQPWSGDRKKEISETLIRIMDYANTGKIDFILIAGDLFDHVPDAEDLRKLDEIFGRLQHTCVIYAAGECDCLEREAALNTFTFTAPVYVLGNERSGPSLPKDSPFYGVRDEKASVLFDCIFFPHFQMHIYGTSFFQEKSSLPVLDETGPFYTEGINLLVAHGGEAEYLPIDFSLLKNRGYQYVALGHRHNYEKKGSANIVYAGTPEPLCYTETGRHGFVEGEITEAGVKLQFHPVSKREYKIIDYPVSDAMTSGEAAEDLKRLLEHEGKEHIYHIRLVRLNDCEKNFQIEELLKDFRIEAVEGQQFERKDYDKYIRSNHNNEFAGLLEHLSDASPVRQDAAKMMVDFVIEASALNRRWSNHLSDRMYEEYRQMGIAHFRTRKDILKNSPEYMEYEHAREQLMVNPDVLDNLNTAWAEERKAELSYRMAKSSFEQIKRRYRRHWMKIGVRAAAIPFIVFCLICILILPYMLMRLSDASGGNGLLLLPGAGIMAVVISFCLGYLTAGFIDTKIGRGARRLTLQQEADETEQRVLELEKQVHVLHEKRREFQLQESRRQDILEDMSKRERKAEAIRYELQLIEEGLALLYGKEKNIS